MFIKKALKKIFFNSPKVIQDYFFIIKNRYLWKESGCVFIHVPKAAGTSISTELYGRHLGHFTAKQIAATVPRTFRQSFKFAIVRNPWDRALSAYRFAKAGGTSDASLRNAEQYEIPEFESFESFVMDWLPRFDVDSLDYIFHRQTKYLYDDHQNLLVDHIGMLEEIDKTIQVLSCRLGKQLRIQRLNATTSNARPYREFYTEAMAKKIYEIYKSDVDLFQYRF